MPLDDVAVTPLDPERFREVLTPEGLADFEHAMARGRELLEGRTFWNVNSTAHGGGVAEMLRSLIGYVRGVGIDGRWVTIGGNPEFFDITKRLHNRLHGYSGDGGPLGDAERAAYERVTAEHAELLAQRVAPSDVVLLHDPQTAGMVAPLVEKGVPVIWRAHIGLDEPNDLAREAWRFLIGYMERADAYVFSRPGYTWEGLDASKVTVIAPSIDAFSPEEPRDVLHLGDRGAARGGPGRRPPPPLAGDLRAPRRQRRQGRARGARRRGARAGPRRAAAGPGLALGPPQGPAGHRDRVRRARACPRGAPPAARRARRHGGGRRSRGGGGLRRDRGGVARAAQRVRRRVHLALLPMDEADENAVMVNALQRRADVVAQKSLAEGFGLTVAEAMWKGRPVVASDVGGIQDQIEDGRPGTSSMPRTSLPSPTASTACSPTRTTRSAWAPPPRRACATCSSARAIWVST